MTTIWASSRQCLPRVKRLSLQRAYTHYAVLGPLGPSPYHAVPFRPRPPLRQDRRHLLTLAIESSCDDTCVAVLEKDRAGGARLRFNEKISLDNRIYKGIHPLEACDSHNTHLAELIRKALRALPRIVDPAATDRSDDATVFSVEGGDLRLKPDFISVTRGPGIPTSLATGLNIAKGLAVAWGVPLLAVHHMQAHALTPRLVSALEKKEEGKEDTPSPQFPFLSLLVSGGHTLLVSSRSLTEHAVLAEPNNIAVGDMLDKCARMILPDELFSADSKLAMYGPLFEEFAFPGSTSPSTGRSSEGTVVGKSSKVKESSQPQPQSQQYDYGYKPPAGRQDDIAQLDPGFGWFLTPPLSTMGHGERAASVYDFAGLNGQVQQIMISNPHMGIDERRALARATMRLVFEHLTSRVLFALNKNTPGSSAAKRRTQKQKQKQKQQKEEEEGEPHKVKTLVLSGGVASNKFLRHILRAMLDARGHADVELIAPPVSLCTDNAAMIAWTGIEMYEAGYRSGLDVPVVRKWPLDAKAEGGGVLGIPGWHKVA